MAETTRADLVEEIAQRFGYYRKITATGGSTTTIVSTSGLYETDDAHVGKYAYVLTDAGGSSAAPEDQERPITNYVQSTATLTVSPAFTVAVAASDIIEILQVRRSDIENYINSAIRLAGNTWLVQKVDDTIITFVANDYDYTLPSGLVGLLAVEARTGTATPWIPLEGWRVSETPGAQKLVFNTIAGLASGDTIRLVHLTLPSEMDSESSVLGLGEPVEREMIEFVIATTLFLLHNQKASATATGAGFQAHLTQAQYWREEAQRIKDLAIKRATPEKQEEEEE